MIEGPQFVRVAALIGDRARAQALAVLMGGQALTATELARVAGVTKPTMSAHLAKLLGAGLVEVQCQGRHRYYGLADADVAHALETLMGVAFRTGAVPLRSSPREPALRLARLCYDHLAGRRGVELFELLQQRGAWTGGADDLRLTARGRALFAAIDIDVDALGHGRRPLCRACLDWSERRQHLAGALGAALWTRLVGNGWARRLAGTRGVEITQAGEAALRQWLAPRIAAV
ncbi:MAG: helix-turn-helix transcriptional regulator [Planctomycetota bacterium]